MAKKKLDDECLVCRSALYRCNVCGQGYCANCSASYHGVGICCNPTSKGDSWSGSVALIARVRAIPVVAATRVMEPVARTSRVTASRSRILPRRTKLLR